MQGILCWATTGRGACPGVIGPGTLHWKFSDSIGEFLTFPFLAAISYEQLLG